jgi:hypothetical protein
MKINFWVRILCITTLVTAQVYADPAERATKAVQFVGDLAFECWEAFNTRSPNPPLYEDKSHQISLHLPRVDRTLPRATSEQRDTLLQIAMQQAIYLQRGHKSLLKDPKLVPEKDRTPNHYILYWTQLLALDLLEQSEVGFNNINALRGYETLFSKSGIGVDLNTFYTWFQTLLAENNIGLATRMEKRIERLDPPIKNLPSKEALGGRIFGDVENIDNTMPKIVSISTYKKTSFAGIFGQLPPRNGRERQINIQNPSFSIDPQSSPYTIRSHWEFSNNLDNHHEWVNAKITQGKNVNSDNSEFEVTLHESPFEIDLHDRQLSPNNAHLSGLPYRPLNQEEVFSFASHLHGERSGKRVDTFHLLIGDPNSQRTLYLLAEASLTFEEFLKKVVLLSHSTPLDYSKLAPHVAKLLTYIEGR